MEKRPCRSRGRGVVVVWSAAGAVDLRPSGASRGASETRKPQRADVFALPRSHACAPVLGLAQPNEYRHGYTGNLGPDMPKAVAAEYISRCLHDGIGPPLMWTMVEALGDIEGKCPHPDELDGNRFGHLTLPQDLAADQSRPTKELCIALMRNAGEGTLQPLPDNLVALPLEDQDLGFGEQGFAIIIGFFAGAERPQRPPDVLQRTRQDRRAMDNRHHRLPPAQRSPDVVAGRHGKCVGECFVQCQGLIDMVEALDEWLAGREERCAS